MADLKTNLKLKSRLKEINKPGSRLPESAITDKAIIIEIYNSKQSSEWLSQKYSHDLGLSITTGVIARIKGRTGIYGPIIKDWQIKMARFLFRRQYGYDIISDSTPPPWGKKSSKVKPDGKLFIKNYYQKTG